MADLVAREADEGARSKVGPVKRIRANQAGARRERQVQIPGAGTERTASGGATCWDSSRPKPWNDLRRLLEVAVRYRARVRTAARTTT